MKHHSHILLFKGVFRKNNSHANEDLLSARWGVQVSQPFFYQSLSPSALAFSLTLSPYARALLSIVFSGLIRLSHAASPCRPPPWPSLSHYLHTPGRRATRTG